MEVVLFQKGGGGDGDGFVAGGEECPAVGGALGDVECFSFFKLVQYWQIIDATLRSLWELKAWLAAGCEIAVLEAH